MAFRATQRPQPARQVSIPTQAEESQANLRAQDQQNLADQQEEWVLFSPSAQSTTQTETTSTDRTPRTAGLSRLSDFGSLETGAGRSDNIGLGVEQISDQITENGTDQDEDADLDSLDDGLHAFQEPSDFGSPRARIAKQSETVLPTHDGLGTFGESSAVQDQLRQFERHGGRRRLKRGASVTQTLSALKEVEEKNDEEARVSRIENWRLEQSRALLEEIERETRRIRRISRSSAARSRASSMNMQTRSETDISASGYATPTPQQAQSVAHVSTVEDDPPQNESFWKRITRRVIRDLIGIDETILSVIFGEKLVEDTQDLSSSTSSLPPINMQQQINEMTTDQEQPVFSTMTWQERLLERLAKELGILVHQLSEHPGAFSTYLRTQEPPLYAGLPNTATLPGQDINDLESLDATPKPTSFMANAHQQVAVDADPSLWGIEEDSEQAEFAYNALSEAARLAKERDYWEKDLDINMVFGFLKSRFSRGLPSTADRASQPSTTYPNDIFGASLNPTSSHNSQTNQININSLISPIPLNARRSSTTSAFTAHRAAIIRQHHPLASATATTATSTNQNNNASTTHRRRDRHHLHHNHHHGGITRRSAARTTTSSCASQSTKKSKRSGSSRNYWDLGHAGSIGSGNGGVGAWGNVSV